MPTSCPHSQRLCQHHVLVLIVNDYFSTSLDTFMFIESTNCTVYTYKIVRLCKVLFNRNMSPFDLGPKIQIAIALADISVPVYQKIIRWKFFLFTNTDLTTKRWCVCVGSDQRSCPGMNPDLLQLFLLSLLCLQEKEQSWLRIPLTFFKSGWFTEQKLEIPAKTG